MNAPESIFLPDVQATPDTLGLAIQQVGVKGLRYPLQLAGADGQPVATVATLAMTVGLPPEVKGTHMSRFVELMEMRQGALTQDGLCRLLDDMLLRLDARSGRIELSFPYFIRKTAPVSGVESLLDYDVTLVAERHEGERTKLTLRVVAAVTSLCPCSKEISERGAQVGNRIARNVTGVLSTQSREVDDPGESSVRGTQAHGHALGVASRVQHVGYGPVVERVTGKVAHSNRLAGVGIDDAHTMELLGFILLGRCVATSLLSDGMHDHR